MRHILRSQDFSKDFLEQLFNTASKLQQDFKDPKKRIELQQRLRGRILLSEFFEPSTRTRHSFEFAGVHLGMMPITTENAKIFSSFAKGESMEDAIRVICSYRPDVIVIRHDEEGSVAIAASVSTVPIINAGDGKGQHPTQALLDLYTIQKELGRVDNLNVVIGGDLKNGRTVRSLAYLLSKFSGINLIFVSAAALSMEQDLKDHLKEKGTKYQETENLQEALPLADVIYWTRTQKERFSDESEYNRVKDKYRIGVEELKLMKNTSILLHPLPRTSEIDIACDSDPRAAYFRQAENGLYVRMALLLWILEG